MAGLEINKQFFNEAFSKLKEEQKQLKNEIPETATNNLKISNDPIKLSIINKNGENETVTINKEMERILGSTPTVTEKEAWKFPPNNERIMRRDIEGWINIEKSLWEIKTDVNWNLVIWESINIYIDAEWTPLETNLQYFNNWVGYNISINPNWDIEFTKWWEITSLKFNNKSELKWFLSQTYPNYIPKSLDYFIPGVDN